MPDIGYYTLPVILSFKGIDQAVNKELGDKLKPAAKKAGEDFAKQAAEGVKASAPEVKVATEAVGKAAGEGMKKAGTEAGKQLEQSMTKATKEATTKVGTEVGKQLEQSITKSTTGSGGLKKAAKNAADEFRKGFREGVEQTLGKDSGGVGTAVDEFGKGLRDGIKQAIEEHGGVASTLDVLSEKIQGVTTDIGAIGDAFGVGTTGIQNASKTVTDAIDGIGTSVASTKTALEQFKSGDVGAGLQSTVDALKGLQSVGLPEGTVSAAQRVADDAANARTQIDGVIGPLENLTKLAGPDSKLFAAGKKLPLVGDLLELGIAAHDSGNEIQDFIKQTTGLNVPLSGIALFDQITGGFHTLTTAAEQSQAKLDAALAAARAAGPAPSVAERGPRSGGRAGGRAGGGSISGPGGPTSDIIPIWASAGEHVLAAADVAAMGGQANVYKFRNMLHGFAGGGAVSVTPDELRRLGGGTVNLSILQALRSVNPAAIMSSGKIDHSPDGGYHPKGMAIDVDPSSQNLGILWGMRDQLAQIIFDDPSRVWYNVHGERAEGPAARAIYGPGTMAQHRNHIHVAALHVVSAPGGALPGYDTGPGSGGGAGIGADLGGGTGGGLVGDLTDMISGGGGGGGGGPSSAGGGGGSINLPSSLAGFGTFAGEQIGKQLGDEKLGKLTAAAGSFIDGQVASALDVFGVPSSPGWLKGISTLVGGISIGGGGSAAPLAASPNATGTSPPDNAGNMHGTRAGQPPGVTYNITARDTEDAFVRSQRIERERAAAKLSRF